MTKKKTTTTTTVVTETDDGPQSALISTLIDRSGSMANMWQETVGGYDAFLKEQKEQPGDARFSLAFFDSGHVYDDVYAEVEAKSATGIPAHVAPRGMTPLYDAIVRQISAADSFLAEYPDFTKVILVIMSDGMENSSSEFPGEAGRISVRNLISEREAADWQFIFLGANIDTQQVATGLGIRKGFTTTYDSGTVSQAYTSTATVATASRGMNTTVTGHADVTTADVTTMVADGELTSQV
jgi:hypothetical protein